MPILIFQHDLHYLKLSHNGYVILFGAAICFTIHDALSNHDQRKCDQLNDCARDVLNSARHRMEDHWNERPKEEDVDAPHR